jgi:sulfonate transport system substrate-binding protein
MDRRRLLIGAGGLGLGALGLASLAACTPRAEGNGGQTVLKVGNQRAGTKSVLVASGALAGAPYKVEWSEFAAAQPLLEALGAGAVDLGEVGDAPFLYAYAGGARIKAVLTSKSGGASTAVLVRDTSPIRAPADLRGKKIATGRGSIGHYLLLKVLEGAGLKPTDAQIVFLSPGDAKAAFSSGAIDGWVTWGLYIPLALAGGGRVLATGEGLISGYGYEAATEAAIAAKRPQILDFLHRLAVARRWAVDHPKEYAAALSKETGLDPAAALYTVQRYRSLPLPTDEAVIAEATAVFDTYRNAGAVSTTRDIRQAFDTSFNAAVTP